MRLAFYVRSTRPRARRFRFEQWLQRMLDNGCSEWNSIAICAWMVSSLGAGMVRSNAAMVWYALMPPAVAH